MTTKIKFGECLHLLMSSLDISNSRLSKGLNLDSSLISRWLHEKRIPAYHSNYIESISSFLSEGILNSFQKQRLDDAINLVCPNLDETLTTKDRIMKALLESQGFSLECKKNSNNKTSTFKSLKTIDLSKDDKIIMGSKSISSALLYLLEESEKNKDNGNKKLYLAYNDDLSYIYIHMKNLQWKDIILKLLKNGWTVVFLFRINHNQNLLVNFMIMCKPLMDTGKFFPYYYKTYDELAFGTSAVIIPGIGALSCISTDCGFFMKNQIGIELLSNYFHSFLLTSAKSLFKYYNLDEGLDFNASLLDSEERAGNRFLFKDNLSITAVPYIIFEKLLGKLELSTNEKLSEFELYQNRLNAFSINLKHYEHFDIYTLDSIQKIIKQKQFSFTCQNSLHTVDLENEDIILILKNIIDLLSTYNNYNLAFVNETSFESEQDNFFCYMIKEKFCVHIQSSKVKASIEEPMILNSLQEHFKDIWKHIAPIDKNKDQTISWLENQINLLVKTS